MKVIGDECILAALQDDLPVQPEKLLQLDVKWLLLLQVLTQVNELAVQLQQPAV